MDIKAYKIVSKYQLFWSPSKPLDYIKSPGSGTEIAQRGKWLNSKNNIWQWSESNNILDLFSVVVEPRRGSAKAEVTQDIQYMSTEMWRALDSKTAKKNKQELCVWFAETLAIVLAIQTFIHTVHLK